MKVFYSTFPHAVICLMVDPNRSNPVEADNLLWGNLTINPPVLFVYDLRSIFDISHQFDQAKTDSFPLIIR